MSRSVSPAVQFYRALGVVDLREDRGVWGVGRNRSSRSLKSASVLVANEFASNAIRCTNLWCERRFESAIHAVHSTARP